MVITTYDKKEYIVSNKAGEQLKAAAMADPKPEFLDLYGDGKDVIATSNISGFHADVVYDKLQIEAPKLPSQQSTPHQERWYKILQLNKQRLSRHGGPYKRVGIIKTLQELEHWEDTDEWPEYVEPRSTR